MDASRSGSFGTPSASGRRADVGGMPCWCAKNERHWSWPDGQHEETTMTMYADTTRPPRTMTRHEQLLLLRTTGQRFDGYRDHVLLSLALATGMREHELV